jgi:hypothetical protein
MVTVRFLANNNDLWNRLEGRPVKIYENTGTVQLRFEGIDAIEKGAIQPLSKQSLEKLLNLIGYNRDTNPTLSGYILSRMTDDVSRRPICFVFSGNTNEPDGKSIFLEPDELENSVNYQLMLDGFAYPLYYNTLFASLREKFTEALVQAKDNDQGYWPHDATKSGVTVTSHSDLSQISPIWPKIWRRLDEYLKDNPTLDGFIDWLDLKNERIDILSIMEERGLQDIVKVTNNNKVGLSEPPENIRVVGLAGLRNRR